MGFSPQTSNAIPSCASTCEGRYYNDIDVCITEQQICHMASWWRPIYCEKSLFLLLCSYLFPFIMHSILPFLIRSVNVIYPCHLIIILNESTAICVTIWEHFLLCTMYSSEIYRFFGAMFLFCISFDFHHFKILLLKYFKICFRW